jgi:hypothetical protein
MGCTTSANKDVASSEPETLSAGEKKSAIVVHSAATTGHGEEVTVGKVETVSLPDVEGAARVEASTEFNATTSHPVVLSTVTKPPSTNSGAPASSGVQPVQQTQQAPRGPPLKKGFILKEGHLVKNWKNRFFVLDGGVMTYYESSTDKPPYGVNKKGEIILKGAKAKVEKNIITISHVGDAAAKGGQETLTLEIRYPTEKEEWFEAITSHIVYYSAQP